MAEPTVTYFAKSLLVSKTAIANSVIVLAALFLDILQEQAVIAIMPARFTPYTVMAVAVLNIILRRFTVRPVALIPPGDTKAVEVERIGPTAGGNNPPYTSFTGPPEINGR